jgi:replicative DNA helicase
MTLLQEGFVLAASRNGRKQQPPSIPKDWQPRFREAENLVLGALMAHPDFEIREGYTVVNACIENGVKPEHFKTDENRVIAEQVWALIAENRSPEPFDVIRRLSERGLLETAGGMEAIQNICTAPLLSAIKIDEYITALLAVDTQWEIVRLTEKLRKLAYIPGGDRQHLLSKVRAATEELLASFEVQGEIDTITNIVVEVLAELGERAANPDDRAGIIPTGFADLDRYMGGWTPKRFTTLAARPGVGKTSFALSTAVAALRYAPVLIFTLEMDKNEIVKRMLNIDASIPADRFKFPKDLTKDDWDALAKSAERFSDDSTYRPCYICDIGGVTISQIASICRRLIRKRIGSNGEESPGIGLVIIDYLQLLGTEDINSGELNRVQELSVITRKIKTLSMGLAVPFLVLSQLNRAVENRQNHIPIMADLRDSGSIEQDSDNILFLYRTDGGNGDLTAGGDNPLWASDDQELPLLVTLKIAKQRNGRTGEITLRFIREYTRYESCPDEQLSADDDLRTSGELFPDNDL